MERLVAPSPQSEPGTVEAGVRLVTTVTPEPPEESGPK